MEGDHPLHGFTIPDVAPAPLIGAPCGAIVKHKRGATISSQDVGIGKVFVHGTGCILIENQIPESIVVWNVMGHHNRDSPIVCQSVTGGIGESEIGKRTAKGESLLDLIQKREVIGRKGGW